MSFYRLPVQVASRMNGDSITELQSGKDIDRSKIAPKGDKNSLLDWNR